MVLVEALMHILLKGLETIVGVTFSTLEESVPSLLSNKYFLEK